MPSRVPAGRGRRLALAGVVLALSSVASPAFAQPLPDDGPRTAAATVRGSDVDTSLAVVADSHVVRARRLARAGRVADAIDAYESHVADVPSDAAAWRELAVQLRRAGRPRDGVAALERAQALRPAPATARQIRQWRAATATAVEPVVLRTRDSDGIATMRTGVGVSFADFGQARLTAAGAHRRTTDGLVPASVTDGRMTLAARPRPTVRVDLVAGVVRTAMTLADTVPAAPEQGAGGGRGRGGGDVPPRPPAGVRIAVRSATLPTASARVRWSAPAFGPSVDVRVGRALLDASPLLVRNRVLRDEVAAQAELPTGLGLRLRAAGRVGAITSTIDRNRRTLVAGALVRPMREWGEVTLTAQQFTHARRVRSGYFAPRLARIAEVGTYVERESARGTALALDAGVGMQQVREHGAALGSWQRSLRGTASVTLPVGPGRSLNLEVEGFDGRIGSDAATVDRWRYGSTSLGLRWTL